MVNRRRRSRALVESLKQQVLGLVDPLDRLENELVGHLDPPLRSKDVVDSFLDRSDIPERMPNACGTDSFLPAIANDHLPSTERGRAPSLAADESAFAGCTATTRSSRCQAHQGLIGVRKGAVEATGRERTSA
jgi:hypothetical protein